MITLKPRIISYILIFLVIFFTSCGYKLRDGPLELNNLIISIYFEPTKINLEFVAFLKKNIGIDKLHLNQIFEDSDLFIEIQEHSIARYSAALGSGARTKEARLEHFLKLGLRKKKEQKNEVIELKDSSNYSFDESKILAIEQIEKQIKENFYTNAINRINFIVLSLTNEDS